MSLATSGGGLGGAGGGGGGAGAGASLAMAQHANAVQRVPAPQFQQTAPQASGTTTAPPQNLAALAADLVDKQHVSVKQMRLTSHLPLVAVDLYASSKHCTVALVPPKHDNDGNISSISPVLPVLVGKMKAQVALRQGENAHKVLRKYLGQSVGFDKLQEAVWARPDDPDAVVLEAPHLMLGLRRLADTGPWYKAPSNGIDDNDNGKNKDYAIAPSGLTTTGTQWVNSTLDGSPVQHDDFDRVVATMKLAENKKAVSMLPEEATQLVLRQAQQHVATKLHGKSHDDDNADDIGCYPVVLPIPACASHDAAVEALHDAAPNAVILPRPVCVLAGALLPPVLPPPPPAGNATGKGGGANNKQNPVLQRLLQVRIALQREHERQRSNDAFKDDMLVLLLGISQCGVEATAISVSLLQTAPSTSAMTCPFGHYVVHANVAKPTTEDDAFTSGTMQQTMQTLGTQLEAMSPDLDGPVGIVTYGAQSEQERLTKAWYEVKDTFDEWQGVPLLATKETAIVLGTAVLGAVAHGRISQIASNGSGKPKAKLALDILHVAPVALGVRFNYHGGDQAKWTPVKTLFDFDRRVPAGPYVMDLKASECVVYRKHGMGSADQLSDEAFAKVVKDVEGSKGIPQREEAALNLKVQLLQRWTRNGDWKLLGDAIEPLVKEGKDEADRVACESISWEVSMGVTGLVTTAMVGERESVVQATKSARSAWLTYWFWVLFAILFFGGFLARSYWEGYVLDRDTAKLLAYYEHVIPGSMGAGDADNARYLVYKYRNKKDKLWRTLERKYGEPMRDANAWEGYKRSDADDEHEVDLDGDDEEPTSSEASEEPDL